MGYDPSKKAWVMAYRRLMGYPPYPNSGRAKKYGVPGIMGYQDLWVKGTSTVAMDTAAPSAYLAPQSGALLMSALYLEVADVPKAVRILMYCVFVRCQST